MVEGHPTMYLEILKIGDFDAWVANKAILIHKLVVISKRNFKPVELKVSYH